MTAAETLGTLGGQVQLDATVADALFHLISHSRDDPQFAAREALKALAPWLPREALMAHLGDGNWEARNSSLEALIALGPAAPSDMLVAAVGDVSEHIRATALEALRELHPELLPPLVEEALSILQGKPAGPTLESLVRFFQAETIARREVRSPEAISHLTKLLQWPYWLVRLISIEALTDIGEPWPPITRDRIEHLIHDPESDAVRSAAGAAPVHGN
jgi:HEAT repeat protein